MELWEGPKDTKKKGKKGQGNVKVSQPISQGQSAVVNIPMMTSPGTTSINSLPSGQQQPQQDYNNMYQQDNTPLVGAASPGMEGFGGGGVMAANEGGGGAWGSAFGGGW